MNSIGYRSLGSCCVALCFVLCGWQVSLAQKQSNDLKTPEEALAIYADAASFQTNQAYPLAIEEWEKLIRQFPSDPIIPKVRHYLGVCYLQLEEPEFDKAIAQFKQALGDKDLEVREESLVNLGWSLYMTGRAIEDAERKERLTEGRNVFRVYLKQYRDGNFADRALFYAGECENLLGNPAKAAKYYQDLIGDRAFAKSGLLPDALYSLGVAYEEDGQTGRAQDAFERFLADFPDHRLIPEVQLRQADILLNKNEPQKAAQLFSKILADGKTSALDYALYRYGYALAKSGDFQASAEAYERLSSEFPDSQYAATSRLASAQALMRDKNFDEAASKFESLLSLQNPAASESAHWLAQIKLMQNKPAEAASIAEQALAWTTDDEFKTLLRMDLADGLNASFETKQQAFDAYSKIYSESPKHALAPRALYNAAFVKLQTGQPKECLLLADQFTNDYPKDPLLGDAQYLIAESSLQTGKFEEAASIFQTLIAKYPDAPSIHLWRLRLGTAFYLSENYESVIKSLLSSYDAFPDDFAKSEAQFLMGAAHLKQDQIDESIKSLQQSYELAPQRPQIDEVLLLLAEAFSKANEDGKAKATLEKLLEEFPNSPLKPQAELRLGELANLLGEPETAIARFDAVLKDESAAKLHDFATFGKATALSDRQQFDAAIGLLRDLAKPQRRDKMGDDARMLLALCLRRANKPEAAAAALKEVLSNQPAARIEADARFDLGLAYTDLGRHEEALQQFQTVLSRFPNSSENDRVLYEIGWSAQASGNIKESREAFKQLAERYPESRFAAEASYHLGQENYDANRYGVAAQAYAVAFKKSTDADLKEKAIHKLAWSNFKQDDFAEASKYFSKQLDEFPAGGLAVDGRFMLAECKFKSEQFAEALEGLNQVRSEMEAGSAKGFDRETQALVYLHGGQCARELKRWDEAKRWLQVVLTEFDNCGCVSQAKYELAFCYQNQKDLNEALRLYGEVASENRDGLAARSRFMIGEVHFANRDYAKAVPEYQRVMYGYGGERAPDDVKVWQARAAMEAGRCAEILIGDLKGDRRTKAIEIATGFYRYVVEKHPKSDMRSRAEERLKDLERNG